MAVTAHGDGDGDGDGEDDDRRPHRGNKASAVLPDTGSPARPSDLVGAILLTITGAVLVSRTGRRGKHAR